jgi:hypothetical protein
MALETSIIKSYFEIGLSLAKFRTPIAPEMFCDFKNWEICPIPTGEKITSSNPYMGTSLLMLSMAKSNRDPNLIFEVPKKFVRKISDFGFSDRIKLSAKIFVNPY